METGQYVIIRAAQAGVFAGTLTAKDGGEVELAGARRLWYWDGAATLSQLALEGVSKPQNCKFPPELPSITVLGVCEIIPVAEAARMSIAAVAVWRA